MIEKDKKICGGEPRIKGTRLTVAGILGAFYGGKNIRDIIRISDNNGVKVSKEEIREAINYAMKFIK